MDRQFSGNITVGDRIHLGFELLAEDDRWPPRALPCAHGMKIREYATGRRGRLEFVIERLRDVVGRDPRPWGAY